MAPRANPKNGKSGASNSVAGKQAGSDGGSVGGAATAANGGGDGNIADLGSIPDGGSGGNDSGGAAGVERPKRPYKRRNGPAAKTNALDLTNLNKVLAVTHSMLANITGIIELELSDDESKSLSGAMADVMSHYNISFIDDKTTAWINLGQVMFGTYASRIMANRLRRSTERSQAAQRAREAADNPNASQNPNAPAPPSRSNVTVQQPGLPPVNLPN